MNILNRPFFSQHPVDFGGRLGRLDFFIRLSRSLALMLFMISKKELSGRDLCSNELPELS